MRVHESGGRGSGGEMRHCGQRACGGNGIWASSRLGNCASIGDELLLGTVDWHTGKACRRTRGLEAADVIASERVKPRAPHLGSRQRTAPSFTTCTLASSTKQQAMLMILPPFRGQGCF